jgi:hypothetical protein
VRFEIRSAIHETETIATGRGIRIPNDWSGSTERVTGRKLRGRATVRFEDGTIAEAELHWFEAHGIGKRRMKIKRLL